LLHPHTINSLSWAVFPKGKEALLRVHRQLKEHIDYINNYKPDGKNVFNFTTVLKSAEKVSKDDLNSIHKEFEEHLTSLVETATGAQNKVKKTLRAQGKVYDKKLEVHLNGVNGMVHAMEHLVTRPLDSSSSWFSVNLRARFADPSSMRVPLKPAEFYKFTLGCKWGDLLLGYGNIIVFGMQSYHIFNYNIFRHHWQIALAYLQR